ncbi:MAG: transposase, partial [Alphaproteobacteria bacterium]
MNDVVAVFDSTLSRLATDHAFKPQAPRGKKANELARIPLRIIEIKHPKGQEEPFRIVTNSLDASASRIAGWHKERWSIELSFKWLKQNLKIKRFMGESRSAMMIQIFVALISYVLLKLYQAMNQGIF